MHGTYRIIERLLDEALEERRRQREYYGRPENPRADLEQEVKLLYARGELDAETYRRLLEMAQNGQLDWENLASFQGSARGQANQRRRRDPDKIARARSPEIVRKLNQLYTHRSRLDAAQAETERVLKTLARDVARLEEQAETSGNKAQQALPDVAQARQHLEVKQDALSRAEALQERMAALRQNLDRIEKLRSELATREAELRALESGEQLSSLEADIRDQLLDDGSS
jgi:chromosome segregation ATPase